MYFICVIFDTFKILNNIYDGSIVIVFENLFLELFWDFKNLFFDEIFFKISLYLLFFFFFWPIKQQNWFCKNCHNSGVVSRRKLPNPSLSNIFIVIWIFCRLVHIQLVIWMTWFWHEVPNYIYVKKFSHQNSRLLYKIFPILKQKVNLNLF